MSIIIRKDSFKYLIIIIYFKSLIKSANSASSSGVKSDFVDISLDLSSRVPKSNFGMDQDRIVPSKLAETSKSNSGIILKLEISSKWQSSFKKGSLVDF